MIPGHETVPVMRNFKDIRSNQPILTLILLSKLSRCSPLPTDWSCCPTPKFPTHPGNWPFFKNSPGAIFQPCFLLPSRNWPFCRSPRAFFQDQAFSLLPARPCCPGQQESTTTQTNRFRRQGQAVRRAITKYWNLPTRFAKNRLDNQELKFLCRTRFRERSERRFLFPSNYSCCRHTELDSCNNPMVGTFFTLLGLSKGHFDVGLTVFHCHIFILDLKLCHGFILCDSRCTFFGLEHTQPYIFSSEVFYVLLLHLPSCLYFLLAWNSHPNDPAQKLFVF